MLILWNYHCRVRYNPRTAVRKCPILFRVGLRLYLPSCCVVQKAIFRILEGYVLVTILYIRFFNLRHS